MAKAISQTKGGHTVGTFLLGVRAGVAGSVRQEVHDGDTVSVRTDGNFGVRLLGVDTPEISFQLPGQQAFRGMASPEWQSFLDDPFAGGWAVDGALKAYLLQSTGPNAAANHYKHALAAERAFEAEVAADIAHQGLTEDTFRFFMAFGYEVIDRYGRFLGYINRDQPKTPPARPLYYNERLLKLGVACPYFIWPNVDPFVTQPSVSAAVIPAGSAVVEGKKGALGKARKWVATARTKGLGVFDAADPLALEPFEVRFLARQKPPDRYLIDLTKANDQILAPQSYHTVQSEDRLWIPAEYVPLFQQAGWQLAP